MKKIKASIEALIFFIILSDNIIQYCSFSLGNAEVFTSPT